MRTESKKHKKQEIKIRQNIIKDLANKCEKGLEYMWLKHYKDTGGEDELKETSELESRFNRYREKYIKNIDKVKNEHILTKLEKFLGDMYHNKYLKTRAKQLAQARELLSHVRQTKTYS